MGYAGNGPMVPEGGAGATPAPPASPGGLEVVEVSVGFGGVSALDRVSLQVGPGQVVGVIGPNGAGKTTLLNVICGFVKPSSGILIYRGEPMRPVPHRLASIGLARTLQGVGLWKGLTVVENVMVGSPSPRRWPARCAEREVADHARQILDQLGLSAWANHLPAALPYGVQKQVALARALASKPSLLLLDEPASGLAEEEMGTLARQLVVLRGQVAILLVEHRVDLVMAVSDRLVVLDFGQVIASGAPEAVRSDPAVISTYLGARQ